MRKIDQFKIKASVEVNTSGAKQSLDEVNDKAKDTSGKLGKLGDAGEKSGSKLGKFFSACGKGATTLAKWTATGIGVASTAIAGVTVKALSAAGELEQNMGGSEAVFGKFADKVQAKAKEAFSNMGLSTSDYLATANKMGALFQGAGFETEKAMTMSQDAMQRAADVASIMGIDTSSAMEAIAGAAKGNFTMMDNLGVAMNDTTLQAYALEKGIEKSTTEMTNQEKIGLAMEMFMEKTAYAAGNYAKENETLAGSLGTAKAAFSNFLSGAGSVDDVVSSFSNLADVVVKNIDEMFPKLMTGFTQIVQKIVPLIPPLLNKLLPGIIEGATGLINGLVAALPAIIDALMGALPALIQGVQTIINALIAALPQIIQSLVAALPTIIPQLVNAFVDIIVTLCTMLPQIIQPIINYLPAIIISIVNALIQNLPALIQGLISLTMGIVSALPQIIQTLIGALPQIVAMVVSGLLQNLPALIMGCIQLVMGIVKALPQICAGLFKAIPAVIKGIVAGIKNAFAPVTKWFKSAWESIKNIFVTVGNAIKTFAINAWNSIKNGITTAINAIKNVITTVWNAIKNAVSTAINAIKNVITTVWNAIKNAITTVMNGIKNVISNVWNGIKNAVSTAVNAVRNTVSNVFNSVKAKVSSIFNGIKSTATNVWNGIKNAITQPIETARDKIKGIIDKIKGFFTGAKLQFPKIKMPHFSIKPSGWKIGDLLEGSIPKLGIEWYSKAMDNPMLMTKPTIFGYNAETGTLQGGGEDGSEVISGTNTLMNMIQGAVASQNSTIVVYLQHLIELLATYFPQILEAAGHDIVTEDGTIIGYYAPKFDEEFGKIRTRKGKGR